MALANWPLWYGAPRQGTWMNRALPATQKKGHWFRLSLVGWLGRIQASRVDPLFADLAIARRLSLERSTITLGFMKRLVENKVAQITSGIIGYLGFDSVRGGRAVQKMLMMVSLQSWSNSLVHQIHQLLQVKVGSKLVITTVDTSKVRIGLHKRCWGITFEYLPSFGVCPRTSPLSCPQFRPICSRVSLWARWETPTWIRASGFFDPRVHRWGTSLWTKSYTTGRISKWRSICQELAKELFYVDWRGPKLTRSSFHICWSWIVLTASELALTLCSPKGPNPVKTMKGFSSMTRHLTTETISHHDVAIRRWSQLQAHLLLW